MRYTNKLKEIGQILPKLMKRKKMYPLLLILIKGRKDSSQKVSLFKKSLEDYMSYRMPIVKQKRHIKG